jgi:hypothetical protein
VLIIDEIKQRECIFHFGELTHTEKIRAGCDEELVIAPHSKARTNLSRCQIMFMVS